MRTQTVGTVTLTFPDSFVWAGDKMIMTATGTSDPVALKIVVGYQQSYPKTLEYHSTTTFLAIDIRSTVIAWCEQNNYGNVSIQTKVYENGIEQGTIYTTGMTVVHGLTRADRYHGTGEYIQQPTMISPVTQFLALDAAHFDGTGTLTDPVGKSIVDVTNAAGKCGFKYGVAQLVGDYFNPVTLTTVYNEVEKITCLPDNGVVLKYTNTDGCIRYAVGQVLSRSEKVEMETYTPALSALNTIPSAIQTEKQITLRIGFHDVKKAQHLGDIFFSEHIYIVNPSTLEEREIIPEADGLETEEMRGGDVIIEFIVQI